MPNLSYSVPGISCGHCRGAITRELQAIPGVEEIDVDLARKTVTVNADATLDAAIRRAIDDAGYDVA
jgi:copper chaperone CopZ